jgi:hypothetical protein
MHIEVQVIVQIKVQDKVQKVLMEKILVEWCLRVYGNTVSKSVLTSGVS